MNSVSSAPNVERFNSCGDVLERSAKVSLKLQRDASLEMLHRPATKQRARQMSEATVMLAAIERGDSQAAESLLNLVYDELRRLAAYKLAQEAPGQTLQPTALVHEAWLKLVGGEARKFENRTHFFAAAAEAMRRILVESARRRQALRRGGDWQQVDLDMIEPAAPRLSEDVLALNDALEKLEQKDREKAELVKLRYFAGLTMEQAAEALGISPATAHRYWSYARAWLHREIVGVDDTPPES